MLKKGEIVVDKEEKAKLAKEKARVNKAMAERLKNLESEEKMRVRFQNIEFPGASLQFNFQSVKTYQLFDGKEYDLPLSVIDHLNSLAVPVYKMYDPEEEKTHFNPEPKDPSERIVGVRNRFSIIPVSVKRARPTKDPKEEKRAA